jgi:hypothetical protein
MATMTTADLSEYYSNLLVIQYSTSPKAIATIQGTVLPYLMDQLPNQILNAYNINPSLGPIAVGTQLDIIGKYIGVSRTVNGPNGPVSLDDDDFLTLMQFVIIKNTTNSSLASIVSLITTFFPGEVFITDSANMQIAYTIVESLGSANLLYALQFGNYLPVPMAVGISVTVIPSYTNPFFTFSTYSVNATGPGFQSYFNLVLNTPWLQYNGT